MTGSIAFMFVCTVMVLFMTPGLALFYGGMVRRKNTLNTMMFCMAMMGIGIFLWVLIGYSMALGGKDIGGLGIVGGLDNFMLRGVEFRIDETSKDYPEMITVMFNMMFAVISPAIILGAVAERMKFSKMMIFAAVWSILVYYPLAHMAWGGGILDRIGSIDFAGGNVIHISTGVSGLVACLILGRRKGYGAMSYRPHNLPMFLFGGAILWVGWFCFNCGCAGGVNSAMVLALVNTGISSAACMVAWMVIEKIVQKKCTVMGAMTGAIAGLVGITPGAGYVPVWSSMVIGLTTAPICYLAISKIKAKLGYDDALDAFGCHGVGGIWGGIMTGVFASANINDAVPNEGLLWGGFKLFGSQIAAILISCAVAIVMSAIIMFVLKKCGGVRVSDIEEAEGLDQNEHGERAYPAFSGLD